MESSVAGICSRDGSSTSRPVNGLMAFVLESGAAVAASATDATFVFVRVVGVEGAGVAVGILELQPLTKKMTRSIV